MRFQSRMLPSAISVHTCIKSRTCYSSRLTDIKRYYRESLPFLELETAVWLELGMTPPEYSIPTSKVFPSEAVSNSGNSRDDWQQGLPAITSRQDGNRVKLVLPAHKAQTLVGRWTRPADFLPDQGWVARWLRRREPCACWRWSRIIRVQDAAAALMRPPRADADRVGIRCSVAVAVCKAA